MSLDVSPDGETIVFELLGDLYTMPIAGGRARRLTAGMAFNRQPRYSPDGQYLAFISDRSGSANLWIADRQGQNPRQVSKLQIYAAGSMASPAWSPNGRTIVISQMLGATRAGPVAVTQESCWLLAAYDVETGGMRWISDTTPERTRPALGPAFGPQGDLYASVSVPRQGIVDIDEPWRIVRLELATGRMEPELWNRTYQGGMRPALSHDGRYLVYATASGSGMGLRLRDLRQDRERWLARDVLDDPPLWPAFDSRDLIPGYALTPDSKSLIASYGGKFHRIDIATGRTAVIPFRVNVERALGPLTVHQFTLADTAVRTRSAMQPAMSPDGRWVAFSALDRLWAMELPRVGRPVGRPWRVTADSIGEFYPSWSPDGRWIVYSTWKDGEGGAIRRVHVMREQPSRPAPSEKLTVDTALYFHTAVAPDGRRVAAVRAPLQGDRLLTPRDSLDLALVWLPVTGGSVTRVTSLAAGRWGWYGVRFPVDQVYFTADRDRIYVGLTSWRWDGSAREIALRVGGPETWPQFNLAGTGVLSPDRRRALVVRRYTLFELSNARAGGLDTVDLERARSEPFGSALGAAFRWGPARAPWVSWSRDGQRVLFGQGGTLFVGDVRAGRWTPFTRVDIPMTVPTDIPRGTLVFRGARLVTMRRREVIEQGDLVVRDNRIVAVGRTGELRPPAGARIIDVRGATILPGYVDLHDHPWLPRGLHAQQAWQELAMLAYGVTASRDPSPAWAMDVFTYRERERTGELLSPRLFSTGIPYFGTDPPIRNLADARNAVRPNADYFGSETFKVYDDPTLGRQRRTWQLLATAAAEEGVDATVEGAQDAVLDLTVAIDGYSGLEHALPIRIYDDVANLIAQSGTTHTQTYGVLPGFYHFMFHRYGSPWKSAKMRRFVPPSARAAICRYCTHYAGPPAFDAATRGPPDPDHVAAIASGAARIVAKGGRVGMGAHGEIAGLGFHWEMWLHAVGGMPNHEILRSATIVGATAIGHAHDLGSLEPGKLADLQLLDKDPLVDIHNTTSIRYVMKNGRLYRAEDLTEIWPRTKPLAPTYLWEATSPSDSTVTR